MLSLLELLVVLVLKGGNALLGVFFADDGLSLAGLNLLDHLLVVGPLLLILLALLSELKISELLLLLEDCHVFLPLLLLGLGSFFLLSKETFEFVDSVTLAVHFIFGGSLPLIQVVLVLLLQAVELFGELIDLHLGFGEIFLEGAFRVF